MKKLVTVVALGLCAAGTVGVLANAASVVNSRNSTSVTNSIDSSESSTVRNSVSSSSNNSSSTVTNNSVISNNGSSVTSSTTDIGGTSTSTNSIVGKTGSMCSAVVEGRRCEVTCRAPQVAQCGKAVDAAEPACLCQ